METACAYHNRPKCMACAALRLALVREAEGKGESAETFFAKAVRYEGEGK